jgi:hypothetical protein
VDDYVAMKEIMEERGAQTRIVCFEPSPYSPVILFVRVTD